MAFTGKFVLCGRDCFFLCLVAIQQQNLTKKTSKILRNKSKFRFLRMFWYIPQNFRRHSPECLSTFPGMLDDILFPEMLSNIPRT